MEGIATRPVFQTPVRLTPITSSHCCCSDAMPARADTGVGEHDPDRPEFGSPFVEGLLEGFEIPHVHLASDDPPAGLLDLLDRLLQVLGRGHGVANDLHLTADVDGDDVGAFLSQADGVAATLAPGRPSNEGHLAVELRHRLFPFLELQTAERRSA